MDKTLDLSEDSGFVSSLSCSTSTPSESIHTSRKRKFITEKPITSTVPCSPEIASSTLNESSISRSFEQCNISLFTSKKERYPTTPIKSEPTTFFEQHSKIRKTPPKNYPFMQKLGSPESNNILYKDIKPNCLQKVQDAKVKRSSPAKKRLFPDSRNRKCKGLVSPIRLDPVIFFTKKRNCIQVLEQIYSYLSDADLWTCSQVSHVWKTSLKHIHRAQVRLNQYDLRISINKENCFGRKKRGSLPVAISNTNRDSNSIICKRDSLPALSSSMEDALEIVKNYDNLTLNMCPRCSQTCIVDRNIYQCQNTRCGYIYCYLCNSCSITGPENFVDKCQMSRLQLDRARITSPESPKPFSFLYGSAACDSSGYSTDMETFSPRRGRLTGNVLSDYNREMPENKVSSSRRDSYYIPVIPLTPTKKAEIVEPSSPPKVTNVACSSKSRRNLKRLLR